MTVRRVAITGSGGQLGRQLVAAFESHDWEVLPAPHADLRIEDPASLSRLTAWGPAVVVNAAAWTDVDGCTRDPERAARINGDAAGRVAEAASAAGALAIQVSTNEVFDGERSEPFSEDDEPNPVNPYGASKLRGEQAVAAAAPDYVVVRTAWIFGPGGRNFASKIIEVARRQRAAHLPLQVVADEIGNPTWAPDLADGIRLAAEAWLAGRLGSGILHIAGEPPASRYEWARIVLAGMGDIEIAPIHAADYARPSRVPLRAVLSTRRANALGIGPSDWRAATHTYAAELIAGVPA